MKIVSLSSLQIFLTLTELQDLGHATGTGVKDKMKDVHEQRERLVDECDKPDQHIIDKAVGEWRKKLPACVIAGEDSLKFEHKMKMSHCCRFVMSYF